MFKEDETLIYAVFLTAGLFSILCIFIIILSYQVIQTRIKKEKAFQRIIFNTEEKERNRIAEELHDDLGAKLSAVKMHNEIIMDITDDPIIEEHAVMNAEIVNIVTSEIRLICKNYSSSFLKIHGLNMGLSNMKDILFSSIPALTFRFDTSGLKIQPGSEFSIALFRIIQELVNNSIKHSGCSEIKVNVHTHQNKLVLDYSDNGKGFNPADQSTEGMGLMNIRARINLYNGKMNYNSQNGKGTVFNFNFPASSVTV